MTPFRRAQLIGASIGVLIVAGLVTGFMTANGYTTRVCTHTGPGTVAVISLDNHTTQPSRPVVDMLTCTVAGPQITGIDVQVKFAGQTTYTREVGSMVTFTPPK